MSPHLSPITSPRNSIADPTIVDWDVQNTSNHFEMADSHPRQSQLSRTCLIGTLAYQEIDEKIDVNRKSSGISGVWRTSTECNR